MITGIRRGLRNLMALAAHLPACVANAIVTIVVLVRIKVIQLKFKKKENADKPPVYRTSDLTEAKEILKVHCKNKDEAIRRRSIPNERLRTAFGIENSFTTMNVATHENFVSEIKVLVKINSYEKEHTLIKEIIKMEKYLFVHKYGNNIPYKKFLLIVTLKYSIKRFFNIQNDISEDELSEMCLEAAEKITNLWLESKKGQINQTEKMNLMNILQRIFPDVDVHDGKESPLCKILPSFETLWRVLYRLSAQLKLPDNKAMLEMFGAFGREPSEETYKTIQNDISVENIVKEVLFISPPTRTIYRKDENNNDVGIDVLELHREHMGGNVGFYPQRWAKKDAEKIPFFTFGYSMLACPARRFAPLALGLMADTIIKEFSEYDWEIDFLKSEIFNDSNNNKNDRIKYPEFYLRKI